jgi:hypothetical protein
MTRLSFDRSMWHIVALYVALTAVSSSFGQQPLSSHKMSIEPRLITSPATNRAEKLKYLFEAQNETIAFYGKILDQDSNGLSGVGVKVIVRHWEISVNDIARAIPIERETDATGCFTIDGITGDALDIDSIQKSGYELEPTKSSFGGTSGSIEDPVVFRMWKNDIKEPLVVGEKFFKLSSDGQSFIIDLIQGTISSNISQPGDLIASIQRSEPTTGRKYDWAFRVQANGGGLIEEKSSYSAMYLAPQDNFEDIFQGGHSANDENWGNAITGKRFFLKSRRGQVYGRLGIEVYSSYGDTGERRLWIKYAVNPKGSRLLR